ncbi:putative calcium-binding protein CML14 [Apostasia shenzhenica]|uniref:Putative calcium-binding protein CML14 n=1 Tax=Apostasia shenzhenica TaxID=1088818 RepID=A0A2I0BFK8_9ASPA|nr:putative calcium-binding protein CML14 [Apostasia shenzhenica]
MLQRFVDSAIAITKELFSHAFVFPFVFLENMTQDFQFSAFMSGRFCRQDSEEVVNLRSVKTFTYESLNNIARLINGVSALLLALLPGKATILEGMSGWELRPTFRGPRLPRWMDNGVSSFNQFIHDLSVDSDSSSIDYTSGEDDNDENVIPASPCSRTSRISHTSSFSRIGKRVTYIRLIKFLLSLILWPLMLLLRTSLVIYQLAAFRRSGGSSTGTREDQSTIEPRTNNKPVHLKDHVVQCTTDRRRGVIEDLHLAIEIFIEAIFDIVHKAAHFLLAPSKLYQILAGTSHASSCRDSSDDEGGAVSTAILADADPTPTARQTSFRSYPYEAIRVVTSDGYVLLLERIPRRDSQKVVYLQHGILDSSMGWVSNGVVGSPAFAAYDQGYDVFLGNLRGLVSREHVDKKISSRKYWNYSINEHGTQDIPAVIEKIHEIKTSELKLISPHISKDEVSDQQPYKLGVVCHSLGGAIMLMYIITRRMAGKPHRLSRMILLSPAGFHEDSTLVFTVVEHLTLLLGPLLKPIVPGLYIPTRFFRMLLNKLARDLHNYPALGGLVQTLMGYVVGGDSSNWVGVLGLPHYNMDDMPGVSLQVAIHLAQIKRAKKFVLYDYGSAAANMEAYGSPDPLDLGQYYHLIDVPVDLVAGRKDKVIRPSMLAALLRSLGLRPAGDQIHSLLSSMDANGNGAVEFDELAAAIAPLMSERALVNQEQLLEVFRSFDRDGNGYISAAELARSMARMGQPLTFCELTAMMRQADTDGDGVISFNEFAAVMAKSAHDFLGLAVSS